MSNPTNPIPHDQRIMHTLFKTLMEGANSDDYILGIKTELDELISIVNDNQPEILKMTYLYDFSSELSEAISKEYMNRLDSETKARAFINPDQIASIFK